MRAGAMFLYGACTTIGFFTWYKTQRSIKKQIYSELIFDNLILKNNKKLIHELIEKNQNSINNLIDWSNELKNNFKFIKNISVEQQGMDYQKIIISSAKPIAVFDDNFVVVETGFVLPHLTFSDQETKNLPTIYSATPEYEAKNNVNESILDIIREIPNLYATKIALLFVDETTLILVEKKNPELLFKIRADQVSQSIKLFQSEQIKEIVYQQKKQLKSTKSIVVDFRFENQIVVCPLDDTNLLHRLKVLQKM